MALTLSATLEALLFAAGEPVEKKRLADLLQVGPQNLKDAMNALRMTLSERGLALIETDDAIEMRTAPDAAEAVRRLRESELSRDLGKASLETLAMILYRKGATRSEIDYIRGVNSSAAIRALLLRGLIERGEDPIDKRRARYTATHDALAHLGVSHAEELPRFAELTQTLAAHEHAPPATTE